MNRAPDTSRETHTPTPPCYCFHLNPFLPAPACLTPLPPSLSLFLLLSPLALYLPCDFVLLTPLLPAPACLSPLPPSLSLFLWLSPLALSLSLSLSLSL